MNVEVPVRRNIVTLFVGSVACAALAVSSLAAVSSASAAPTAGKSLTAAAPTTLQVQKHLKALGLPVWKPSSVWTQQSLHAVCLWRDVNGNASKFAKPTAPEEASIMAMTALPTPRKALVTGLNVNRACQTVTWVRVDKKGNRYYQVAFSVSTGKPSTPTRKETTTITRRINGWHNSSSYPSSKPNMWRPAYINTSGEAFHGMQSDSMVKPYPASHGCVRMRHADIDYLWKYDGVKVGTKVYVYEDWRG